MMSGGNAVIGALRGVLVLDTADWTPAINRARGDLSALRGALQTVSNAVEEVGRRVRNVGVGLTLGLTVPLGAIGTAANKTASGFEASMKRVEAALKGVTGKELKALSDQARALGPAVGKGATEAADGIEALGLAGLSTADILGGGLKAALDLAAAGAAPVADAASLVTDTMGQFKVTAAQLPGVITNVVGALDASKFQFIDFQQAVAQGGGIAASAGLQFSDFATAIAATSTYFSSGADAGTSFKTYIQSLIPVSKDAEYAMKQLGIEFFDLKTGRMKPLAEQAEILRKAFDGLRDDKRTDALKTIFGSDAARTAIGLMEQGREGIADLQRQIEGGDVGGKIAKRMEGEAGATVRLANAYQSLNIAIGQAGLTAALAAIKNAFASVVEAMAAAPPALLKVGVVFGVLASAVGPLILILKAAAGFIAAQFIRSWGMVGTALRLVIAPISTVIELVGGMIARFGAMRGLALVGRYILGLAGPIGWAVGALILFKDHVIFAFSAVYDRAVATLGPPLAAIFDKVGAMFGQIGSGPIGSTVSFLIDAFTSVKDVIGTLLTAQLMVAGEVIVRVLGVIVAAMGGIVDVVAGAVDLISKLLTGDFAGAWRAAVGIVESTFGSIVDMAAALVPEIAGELQAVYGAAKAWLADGFAAVGGWVSTAVAGMVNFVTSSFPNIVASARGVYEGVKGWLVDKFGWLLGWVSKAAAFIGNVYGKLKEKLGLGAAAETADHKMPAAPPPVKAPATSGTRNVDLTPPTKGKRSGGRKGRDATYDGANREQLKIEAELEAARARNDKEAVLRIEDRLALSKQVEAYQKTGLSIDKARVEANRDMATIHAARATAAAREIADEQASVALDLARLGTDRQLEQSLERQAELKRRIATYYEQTKNLAEATRLAEADQAQIDGARADVRARWFADDAQARALRLAQDRGESEQRIRQMQREIDIRDRARELQDRGRGEADAIQQAASEWDEGEKARLTGTFRSSFQEGMRSALSGNLGDFAKNWWRDRVAKGMTEAINSLSDLVQRLFANLKIGGEGGAGGILGAIAKAFGAAGSKAPVTGSPGAGLSSIGASVAALPAFNTGGSFKVGGMSGIDRNVVSMRLTKGEMVDIRKPGNDNGPSGDTFVTNVTVPAGVDLATRTEVYRLAGAVQTSVMAKIDERNSRRG